MAGIRGIKNPMPSKGDKPTGIFSTRGRQKNDSVAAQPSKGLKDYAKECCGKVNPVKRDNMLKKS
jgi:hypothetical protein